MTVQEKVRVEVLQNEACNKILQLPTSFGKTKLALDLADIEIRKDSNCKVLIVVPTLILITNWKDEIHKWEYDKYLNNIIFITYKSYAKKCIDIDFGLTIFDEGHHYTERCADNYKSFVTKKVVVLSATLSQASLDRYICNYGKFYIKEVSLNAAVRNKVLPKPRVILIPLELEAKKASQVIVRNPDKGNPTLYAYKDRFKAFKIKDRKVIIPCTEYQYYEDMDSKIRYLKGMRYSNPKVTNIYLRKCADRLMWLSNMKTSYTYTILKNLESHRTLTFCANIEQSKLFSNNSINCKDGKATSIIDKFNKGAINHITACNMLDEGANLVNCQIGVYNVLNSSNRKIIQKIGRFLRHKEPIIIIPYFKDTKEVDIVNKMFDGYSLDLITVLKDINKLEI